MPPHDPGRFMHKSPLALTDTIERMIDVYA
jgi:hypothetical protein